MICVGVSETSGNTVVRSNTVGSFFPLGPRKFMPPIVMRVMVESMLALMMTIFLRSFLSSSPFLPPFSDCANTALTHRKTHNSAEKLILKILVIYTPSEPVRVRTTVTLIPEPGQ